ncbi:hypothetical protein MLD38_020913 [Melastoma candidum]|uniref:Uncharacterized protein n=1 Tax=Melastoma candidum TaxID=119954 RepID=A0ACB9QHV6_9MYRT|nr:hypothetical protein MLD38_020913 [Melastoma candidum]
MDILSFLKNPTLYILIGALLIVRSLALYCYRSWVDLDYDEDEGEGDDELHEIRIEDPHLGEPAIRWLIREQRRRFDMGLRARSMAVYMMEAPLPPLNLTSDTVFSYGRGPESRVKYLECAVCLEEFEDGHECRFLPNCQHVYHRSCIDKWLVRKRLCPLCRAPVHSSVPDSEANIEPDVESG